MSAALIQALLAARRDRLPLAAGPWATVLSSAEQAYAVQDAVAAGLGWFASASPQHWKSGGASRQALLTHAPLPPAGVRSSPASFSDWPLHSPAMEAEIALRLAVDVDPALAARLTPDQTEEIDGLIGEMAVSIELVDSRWVEGGKAPALLKLADQQSHGALALGNWVAYARRDWSGQRCEVRIGTQPTVLRTGSHSLADPAWLLPQWLRHATRGGATLAAGSVVTTGTWVGLLPVQAGDRVEVDFEGIGKASLQL